MNGRQRAFSLIRIGIAIFFVLHAIAHAPGVLGAWKIMEFEDASYRPNVLLTGASDALVAVLGAFWLLAGIGYLVAAIGLVRNAWWWSGATFLAALVSLALSTLWMDDAIVGLVINIAILTALFLLNAWWLWRALDDGRIRPGMPSRA